MAVDRDVSTEEARAFLGLLAFFVLTDNDLERAMSFVTPGRVESVRIGLEKNLPLLSDADRAEFRKGPEIWDMVEQDWDNLDQEGRKAIREGWTVQLRMRITITS